MTVHQELNSWFAAVDELMEVDKLSGKVPDGLTRPLLPHELGTDFAAIEADVDAVAKKIQFQMKVDRSTFIDLLDAYLRNIASSDAEVAAALVALPTLGLLAIPGVADLVERSTRKYSQILQGSAASGALRQLSEAAAQGVRSDQPLPTLHPQDVPRVDLMAQRLATAPHQAVLQAAVDEGYRIPLADHQIPANQTSFFAEVQLPARLLVDLMEGLRSLSPEVLLTTLARPAVQQSDSLGRQSALQALPVATAYHASELLDKSTCEPCSTVDGRTYDSFEAAKSDYPSGGYVNCLGGDRCRGTLLASWKSS